MLTRAFRHWAHRYLYNRFKLFLDEIKHPDHPWLTQQANAILSSWLRKTDVGLEWGSGRSTIWFAKRVAHLTSVEHDPIWYEKVKKELANANITNTKVYCYKTPLKDEEIENNLYVKIADNFPDNSLDFVLVDGIFRSECALRACMQNGYIVKEAEVDALYIALKKVVKRRRLRENMERNSRKILLESFDIKHMVNGFKNALRVVLHTRRQNDKTLKGN